MHTKDTNAKELDSMSLLKDFLKSPALYTGSELTLLCICTGVVKISVESVVESLVSRYEKHFDSSRQLKESRALEEMEAKEGKRNGEP